MKNIPVEETPLKDAVNVAKSLGIFVDVDARVKKDGSVFVFANECGDINTEPFGFVFTYLNGQLKIEGNNSELCCLPTETSLVHDWLKETLEKAGFFQTWVKIRGYK